MTVRYIPRICLAASASITLPLVVLVGRAEASPISVGDPIPREFPDCFGPYDPGLGLVHPGVIFAQPAPAITWGTAGDDIIIGSEGNDIIYGLGGNDRICAGGGGDYVEGGLITGGSGSNDVDHIDGGANSDVLHGGQDNDFIYGSTNFTPIDQYQLHDFLYGDTGDDTLFGELGPDVLSGGTGTDYCDGGTGMPGNRPEDDGATVYCDTRVNIEVLIV